MFDFIRFSTFVMMYLIWYYVLIFLNQLGKKKFGEN